MKFKRTDASDIVTVVTVVVCQAFKTLDVSSYPRRSTGFKSILPRSKRHEISRFSWMKYLCEWSVGRFFFFFFFSYLNLRKLNIRKIKFIWSLKAVKRSHFFGCYSWCKCSGNCLRAPIAFSGARFLPNLPVLAGAQEREGRVFPLPCASTALSHARFLPLLSNAC